MRTSQTIEASFFYRIMVLLLVLFAGIFVTFTLTFVAMLFMNGFDMQAVANQSMGGFQSLRQIQVIQFLQTVFIFILPPFLLCRFLKTKPSVFLSMKSWDYSKIGMGMLSILAMIPLLNVLVVWNQGLHLPDSLQNIELWMRNQEDAAAKITELLMSSTSFPDLLLTILLVAVLTGLGEELLFRGALLRIVGDALKKRMHLSIWLIAIVFSAIHLQFYGFIPRMLLGAWLGYLLLWTGSIWVPIFAHFTNNALSTIVIYGENNGSIQQDLDLIGVGDTWWMSVVSVVLLVLITKYYLKSAQISLRKAEQTDVPTLRKLASRTWFKTYGSLLSKEQMDYMFEWMYSEKSILEQITTKGHVFFLAYEGSKPLGYVSIEKQGEALFHLHKIYIVPSSQGKGIGKKLLEQSYLYAREHTSESNFQVELNVNRGNKALNFYQKMGFQIIDQKDFDIGNGYFMNDYILRKSFTSEGTN